MMVLMTLLVEDPFGIVIASSKKFLLTFFSTDISSFISLIKFYLNVHADILTIISNFHVHRIKQCCKIDNFLVEKRFNHIHTFQTSHGHRVSIMLFKKCFSDFSRIVIFHCHWHLQNWDQHHAQNSEQHFIPHCKHVWDGFVDYHQKENVFIIEEKCAVLNFISSGKWSSLKNEEVFC